MSLSYQSTTGLLKGDIIELKQKLKHKLYYQMYLTFDLESRLGFKPSHVLMKDTILKLWPIISKKFEQKRGRE